MLFGTSHARNCASKHFRWRPLSIRKDPRQPAAALQPPRAGLASVAPFHSTPEERFLYQRSICPRFGFSISQDALCLHWLYTNALAVWARLNTCMRYAKRVDVRAHHFLTCPRNITQLWASSAHLSTASLGAKRMSQMERPGWVSPNHAKCTSWLTSSSGCCRGLLHPQTCTIQHHEVLPFFIVSSSFIRSCVLRQLLVVELAFPTWTFHSPPLELIWC